MTTKAAAVHHKGRSFLLKTGVVAAGSVAAAQATVIASLAGLDWWKHRNRKVRDAPRPGTFTAQVEDSELKIYTSGATVYEDMLDAIDGAQTSIHMETFIWKNDDVGQRFLDALNAAAERGVAVFVIYDGFANLVIPNSFYRFSDKVNVFRMPAVRRKWWRGPLRYTGVNHSKILVVDDTTGFVGGYNIGSMYASQWRDTHVREVGPAVWGLRNSIAKVWNEDRHPREQIEWVSPQNWDPEVRVAANLPVQLVYPIRYLYLSAIERAKDHIWITTPYFIPDQQILDGLVRASKRGVDVRVMVPKDSNHILADWVSRGFYGQLLDAEITILLYAAAMIHAKTATIDGEWSTVGTANIDRLSLSFNYETNVEIIDPDFAAEMEKVFEADSEHCETLSSPRWRDRHRMARFAETVLIPLRPIL
ncbi:phosphatidylserine/phosphatidylglycerophosphate/cardiolipin synthase family protein [Kocuria sp. cx-455]|uniref:phospholipase D-like domain-containing protein n=1 Tax=Kocuria sp. cx-455 TaxID=2771377 RepID=UPI001688D351|nr:phospholipase D-like domain-containing protein [Kocuria sp. cx-455]MBD2763850.1 phosphatidylserine/phosphatidylglycerophosphate/cardiolipin synthase family protein [Kocuria sp. cx-455]